MVRGVGGFLQRFSDGYQSLLDRRSYGRSVHMLLLEYCESFVLKHVLLISISERCGYHRWWMEHKVSALDRMEDGVSHAEISMHPLAFFDRLDIEIHTPTPC